MPFLFLVFAFHVAHTHSHSRSHSHSYSFPLPLLLHSHSHYVNPQIKVGFYYYFNTLRYVFGITTCFFNSFVKLNGSKSLE